MHIRQSPTELSTRRVGARRSVVALVVVVLAAFGLPQAWGQTLYRYVETDGTVVYRDTQLPEIGMRQSERISKSGTHLTAPKPDAATAAGKGTDHATKAPEPISREEQALQRRNMALMAIYNSVKEIDDAREYSLRDPLSELRDAQSRMIAAGRLRQRLQADVAALQPKPVPPELADKLSSATFDFKTLAALVESKRGEIRDISHRFDEDKRHYIELMAANKGTNAP